jgi:hypothetical protein
VQLSDATTPAAQRATAALSISVVRPTITISPVTLPAAVRGAAYSVTLVAAGGVKPYRFFLVSSSPPPGIRLGLSGRLSGRPTRTGTYRFSVLVYDAFGTSARRQFTIVVGAK